MSIIIEYLAQHYPGRTAAFAPDADLARQTRLRDRFFDLYVNVPMQKIVTDRLRPSGKTIPTASSRRGQLRTACGMLDQEMGTKTWAMGEAFTMADCAAAPALFYANMMMPFGEAYKNVAAYLNRLMERPLVRPGARGGATLSGSHAEVRRNPDRLT